MDKIQTEKIPILNHDKRRIIKKQGRPPSKPNQEFLEALENTISGQAVSVEVTTDMPAKVYRKRVTLIQLAYRHGINVHTLIQGNKIYFWEKE